MQNKIASTSIRFFSISARDRVTVVPSGFSGFTRALFTGIFTLLIVASEMSAETWNGIDPLKSQKASVERILGVCPDNEDISRCLYQFKDRNVLVEYTVGPPCSETQRVWNVPNGTVLRVTVYQKDALLLKEFERELRDFRREEDQELTGIEYYSQRERGLTLEVSGGFVRTLYYGPLAADRKMLACSKKNA